MKASWKIDKNILNSLWFYFFLGLAIRGALLIYNLRLGLAPGWTSLTRASLIVSEILSGKAPSLGDSPQAALDLVRVSDRGAVLIHLLLIWILGSTSFLKLRVVNVVLDSSMVLVAAKIGKRLGGSSLAKASAFAYAIFPPAVFICLNPFWYPWLAAGALLSTWIALEMIALKSSERRRFWVYALLLLGVGALTAQFRSTFTFYLFFLGVWVAVAQRLARREKLRPEIVKRAALTFLLLGVLNMGSNSMVNRVLYGGKEPMRSDFGHVLWNGFGEFSNPMQVSAEDTSAMEYYFHNTGKTPADIDYSNTAGWRAYNSWMLKEGVKFIASHPFLYASMVVRRCLKFIFPNFRISRISDLESFNLYEEKVLGTRDARLAIVKSDRLYTTAGLLELWKIDKGYFFEGALRVALIFLLPFLLISGLFWLGPVPAAFFGLSFMAYNWATLGLVRGPDMNLFSVWSASIPLVAAGGLFWWERWGKSKSRRGKRRV